MVTTMYGPEPQKQVGYFNHRVVTMVADKCGYERFAY